jgi:hypothetical protein
MKTLFLFHLVVSSLFAMGSRSVIKLENGDYLAEESARMQKFLESSRPGRDTATSRVTVEEDMAQFFDFAVGCLDKDQARYKTFTSAHPLSAEESQSAARAFESCIKKAVHVLPLNFAATLYPEDRFEFCQATPK